MTDRDGAPGGAPSATDRVPSAFPRGRWPDPPPAGGRPPAAATPRDPATRTRAGASGLALVLVGCVMGTRTERAAAYG